MMENREYLNSLFDIYKDLLTNIEQITFSDYYIEDLSLTEIALNRGISKASVGKTLNNALIKLNNYEDMLGIAKKRLELSKLLDEKNIDVIKDGIRKVMD